MAKAEMTVHVADLPRVKWRIECLETMLRTPRCSQCGEAWLDGVCGPTHAAIAANHPLAPAPQTDTEGPSDGR